MVKAAIDLIPGPTKYKEMVKQALMEEHPSPDVNAAEFLQDYRETQQLIGRVLQTTKHDVVIQTGEGMVALWGAIKSVIPFKPVKRHHIEGNALYEFLTPMKVVALSNGIYGSGIGSMVSSLGDHLVEVRTIHVDERKGRFDLQEIKMIFQEFQPELVTVVHVDTPTGICQPGNVMKSIGELVRSHAAPNALLMVDMVASAGGVPTFLDEWQIDLACLGSQKVFSCPPALAMVAVSDRAWKRIQEVEYQGYDALLPWKTIEEKQLAPYTHYWEGIAALKASITELLNADPLHPSNVAEEETLRDEVLKCVETEPGLAATWLQHAQARAEVLNWVKQSGLELFLQDPSLSSPTCTCICLPENIDWDLFRLKLEENNVHVGGSYDAFAGKVFRLGHMGSQAEMALVKEGIARISQILREFSE